ncbi:MAG TPA: MBL fold metallo-hydrolase [Rhodanobacteraceae bacterium]|nr:MBL fold metallo-hydrolase [Rhodanobacteraceae bacterium]
MSWNLRFIGVGSSQAPELGSACGVLEQDGRPLLMIDCGPEALSSYLAHYGDAPRAVYITHAHMDHVGGLERLFYHVYFDPELCGRVRLFFHAALAPILQGRLADYPDVVADGNANFWDAFSTVLVSRGFWHEGLWFDVFGTRHHAPNTSFGIALAGSFVWTGDTRPVPEMLAAYAAQGELVAHDCALVGNPSHTGLADLEREYPAELRKRFAIYHYASVADAAEMTAAGYRVAQRNEVIGLAAPARARAAMGTAPGTG